MQRATKGRHSSSNYFFHFYSFYLFLISNFKLKITLKLKVPRGWVKCADQRHLCQITLFLNFISIILHDVGRFYRQQHLVYVISSSGFFFITVCKIITSIKFDPLFYFLFFDLILTDA